MKQLFLTLRGLAAGIAGIVWVDKDYKQIDTYTDKPPVSFPCLLIRIEMLSCETIAGQMQLCTGRVTLRLACDLPTVETSAKATQTASDRSLAYYDLADAVYNTFQNYRDGQVSNFDRISQADEDRKDGMLVARQVYTCTFTQNIS